MPHASAPDEPSLFIQSLTGHTSAIPPVWLMRQAGRYLPEYRAVRAKAGSFLDLCYHSDMACEVTLQPIDRFDFDAAILFADILLIPHALGQNLSFVEGDGPKLEPVASPGDLDAFREKDILPFLAPVFETVAKTRAKLSPEKALIGFAGAPWTVATYMLAGGPIKDPSTLRKLYYEDPAFINGLIDVITDKTIDYLLAQIKAGADAVQLFDTWAGGLPPQILEAASVKPLEKIAGAVVAAHPDVPVILFPKGVGEKAGEYAALKNAAGVGIDFSLDPSFARQHLSLLATVQGGLDPLAIVQGGDAMKRAASVYLKMFHDVPYVFNAGHGLVPQTPPEHVGELVKFIRSGDAF